MGKITNIMTAHLSGFGDLQLKADSAGLDLGGFTREPVMGGGRLVGDTESVNPAKFEGTLLHTSDLDLEKLNGIRGEVLTVLTDSGVTWVVSNATVANTFKVSEGGGEAPLELFGDPATTA